MNTTDLFVELIVIGVGASIWVVLFILALFGFAWVNPGQIFSLPALIPSLSIAYVLGIVVDRVADVWFDKLWHRKMLSRFYASMDDYFNDRRLLYLKASSLADLIEYGRSRLRICRGWTLNSLCILVALNLFTWTRLSGFSLQLMVSGVGSLGLLLLAWGTWFAWYGLSFASLRKIKEQAEFIRQLTASGDSL